MNSKVLSRKPKGSVILNDQRYHLPLLDMNAKEKSDPLAVIKDEKESISGSSRKNSDLILTIPGMKKKKKQVNKTFDHDDNTDFVIPEQLPTDNRIKGNDVILNSNSL
jgi:hypothetical protein